MTSSAPGLTVVIPAHNEAAYLPRYLPTVPHSHRALGSRER
ncbi:hypothetical protein ACWEQU_08900 [Streptomyces nodosus]